MVEKTMRKRERAGMSEIPNRNRASTWREQLRAVHDQVVMEKLMQRLEETMMIVCKNLPPPLQHDPRRRHWRRCFCLPLPP
eukprot:34190-Hanusia_phi.AAC.2